MEAFRLVSSQYVDQALSGIGAQRSGGRWNSKGMLMAYAAMSRSLALLELLVHVPRTSVPRGYVMLPLLIPDDAIASVDALPEGWDRLPYTAAVQQAGDAWLRSGGSPALRVPNAIVRQESNLLINPTHARFTEIRTGKPEALVLDERLFG
ncbi:MAG TPA: RES family NAD+ phosphorylase [Steroidobacteraceae bacterium]|nr:RES family NAD+ phosphorylase [Steroidobacteraceae bacterium]